MIIIRLLLKLLALPVMIVVTLAQWVSIFLISFSSIIFHILAGIIFLTAVLSFMFGITHGAEVLRMLAIGFIVFIVPHIGEWFVLKIADLNGTLRAFIHS